MLGSGAAGAVCPPGYTGPGRPPAASPAACRPVTTRRGPAAVLPVAVAGQGLGTAGRGPARPAGRWWLPPCLPAHKGERRGPAGGVVGVAAAGDGAAGVDGDVEGEEPGGAGAHPAPAFRRGQSQRGGGAGADGVLREQPRGVAAVRQVRPVPVRSRSAARARAGGSPGGRPPGPPGRWRSEEGGPERSRGRGSPGGGLAVLPRRLRGAPAAPPAPV